MLLAPGLTPSVGAQSEPRATDGRSLSGESGATRAVFRAVWGRAAAEDWAAEHTAEVRRAMAAAATPAPAGPGTPGTPAAPTDAPAGPTPASAAETREARVFAWGDRDVAPGLGPDAPPSIALGPSALAPVPVVPLDDVVAIASVGGNEGIALKSDGSVWSWKTDYAGQRARGTNAWSTPERVGGLDDVRAIAGGAFHSLALRGDGSVWAWGDNVAGALGNGATGNGANTNTPTRVVGLPPASAIAGGAAYSLALTSDGTVWAWGANVYGQLGNGTRDNSATPVEVIGLADVRAIAAGALHSLALRGDGTVWAWGDNGNGRLGNGTRTASFTPVQVSGLRDVVAIETGVSEQSVALKADGTVWAWGLNRTGQLGSGAPTDSAVPVQVGGLADVRAIASGRYHSLALRGDGTVWAWGDNSFGQLGVSTLKRSSTPLRVPVPERRDGHRSGLSAESGARWRQVCPTRYALKGLKQTLRIRNELSENRGIRQRDLSYVKSIAWHVHCPTPNWSCHRAVCCSTYSATCRQLSACPSRTSVVNGSRSTFSISVCHMRWVRSTTTFSSSCSSAADSAYALQNTW